MSTETRREKLRGEMERKPIPVALGKLPAPPVEVRKVTIE